MYELILPTIGRFLLSLFPFLLMILFVEKADLLRNKLKDILVNYPILYTIIEKISMTIIFFMCLICYVNMAFWGYCLIMFTGMFISYHFWKFLIIGIITFFCLAGVNHKWEQSGNIK